jgi:hypothetical protein
VELAPVPQRSGPPANEFADIRVLNETSNHWFVVFAAAML